VIKKLDVEAKHKEFIRAPREKVYDAFATTDGLNAWFTEGGRVDARPGGEILFRFVDWGADKINAQFTGRVIEARRPERFVFEWGDAKNSTTVELTFVQQDDGTVVSVREHGFVDVDNALGNSSGWGEALTLVKFWVERGLTVHPAR
jgi:glutathione S-transferase